MLRAEQIALEQAAYQQLLQIREKELNYYVNNYNTFGTQAALLAGFTLSALTEISYEGTLDLGLPFHISTAICLTAGLHCVLTTTFVTVWGPGLALRGPKGSMVRAVEGMVKEKDMIFWSFGICAGAFGMLGITCSWVVMADVPAAISTLVRWKAMHQLFLSPML